MAIRMQIQKSEHGNVVVLSFDEDHLNEPENIREAIDVLLSEGRKFFLFDLENVTYISSSVLGYIITTYREIEKNGGALKLLHVQPCVANILHITRLDRVLEMYNDFDTALQSFHT